MSSENYELAAVNYCFIRRLIGPAALTSVMLLEEERKHYIYLTWFRQ